MRGMTREGDEDGENAREQLRQMHEKNTANVFKMARWAQCSLRIREAPYSAASSGITFVSAELEVNQLTGTVHPAPAPAADDASDSEGELFDPRAFPDGSGPRLWTKVQQSFIGVYYAIGVY